MGDRRETERNAEIYRLHISGVRQVTLAEQYGITQQRVSEIIGEARRQHAIEQPVEDERADSAARLDAALEHVNTVIAEMRKILQAEHSKGDGDGNEVPDNWPKFAAADRINAAARTVATLEKRRAELLGLDAETKFSVSGSFKDEIVGVDPAEIVGVNVGGDE